MRADRTSERKGLRLVRRRPRAVREVERSDAEWKDQLNVDQYRVLRRKATERPFTGVYVHPGRAGLYRCAGCGAPLFSADTQFDSGTGWPSFSDIVPESIELHRDLRAGIPRTETVCRRCGGHLGDLFRDGPGPDRSRYCINSCALTLDEDDSDASGLGPKS